MVHPGQGPGLSQYFQGQVGGAETVTLLTSEMPFHNHFLTADSEDVGNNTLPGPTIELAASAGATAYVSGSPPLAQMAFGALSITGASLPHNNMMPYLVLNFCIAMQGIFPPRS
jgi:microcystin-dependent protein